MKKTIIWMLLVAMLLSNTACGKDTGETNDASGDTVAEETVAEVEEVVDPLAFLPENLNYEGQTVTFLQGHAYGETYGNEISYAFDDVVAGDIISESVYERNALVEERLNVKIANVLGSGWDTWSNDLQISLTSGDNAYDVAGGAFPTAYNCIPQGMLFNLKEVSSINLANPWWDKQAIESMTFGNGVYTLSGDINFYDNYSTSCLFFNVDLFTDSNIELPYDAVREGTWTFDKMYGIMDGFYTDTNGDGARGLEDTYGFVSNGGVVWRMTQGMGMRYIVKDENGTPLLNESEELFNSISSVVDLMKNTGSYSSGGDGNYAEIFTAGRALFSEDNFAYLIKARDAVEAYIGILPYPKYDESQEKYCCPINDAYCSVYGIPTSSDKESIGYVLEAMGAASVDTVTEAVIEKNAMVKATRDEYSADMIRIILDSAAFPLETVTGWGNLYSSTVLPIGEEMENTYASQVARLNRSVSKFVEKDMDKILALQ